jgi:hypothetical protein
LPVVRYTHYIYGMYAYLRLEAHDLSLDMEDGSDNVL